MVLANVIQLIALCACIPEEAIPTAIRWAPLFGVVATFLAVLVALFRESLFLRWRRPKLSIAIKPEPPDSNKTQMRFGDGTTVPCYTFRLWVANTGKTTAERVQVFARRLLPASRQWRTPKRDPLLAYELALVTRCRRHLRRNRTRNGPPLRSWTYISS